MVPEAGIRRMSAVTRFQIFMNKFEGALPQSGLQVMRAVGRFRVFQNSFKGTVPAPALRVTGDSEGRPEC
eukprot:3476797-Amphidinium_carterae.1